MDIYVRVQPNSSKQCLEVLADGSYKAYVHTAPEHNRANRELVELLAQEFDVKKYNIEIIKGLTNRDKVVRIHEE